MATYPEYPRGRRIYPEPVVNIVYSVAETIDELADSVVGIRPAGHILEAARMIAPANIIRTVTGVPKPSEFVEEILDRLDEETTLMFRRAGRTSRRLRRIL